MKELIAKAPRITRCRVCGGADLSSCQDLGAQYLSSIFPSDLGYRGELMKYPLELVLCRKTAECGLLQLAHEMDLSDMYAAYPYTSSSNSSMKAILRDVADSGKALKNLSAGDLILDIGANDGTLLSFFDESGCDLLGIDAAQNIVPVFTSPRLRMVKNFFGKAVFDRASPRPAKLIFSIAMFYHLSDPVAFCRDVAACLADDGAWIVQMAYLPAMLETNMYDNVVHEHAGYYGIETMQRVLERAGLEIFDVSLNDVYGGSFRLFIQKKGSAKFPKTARYADLLAREREQAIFDPTTYRAYDARVRKTRDDLTALVRRLKSEGREIWAYGASTKGNTIMQYCGITGRDVTAAADANPFKIGKYIIGSDIPIRDEESMRQAKPDYLLALPYSFVDGFIKREEALVRGGARFIVPLPRVELRPVK